MKPTSLHYLMIGLGGALGAMSRTLLANWLPASFMSIPLQFMIVNIIGCFCMGFIAEFMAFHYSISETMKYFIITGFLGGFTTFSAFALEFGLLASKHQYVESIAYVLLSVFLSLCFFFLGLRLVRLIFIHAL